MLDRFDLNIVLHRLSRAQLASPSIGEPSRLVAERVYGAQERMVRRLESSGWTKNSETSPAWLRDNTVLPDRADDLINNALVTGQLSMRSVAKILRVAWTLADLAGRESPAEEDIHEAFALRSRGVSHV